MLVRGTPDREAQDGAVEGRSWIGRFVWGAAAVGLVVGVFAFVSFHYVYERAFDRGDYLRASAVLDQLAWVGYDRANPRMRVATRLARTGEIEAAVYNMERSVKLRPDAEGYFRLGAIQEREDQRLEAAHTSYARALELEPDHLDALSRAARVAMKLGRPSEASGYLERAESVIARRADLEP